MAQPAFPKLPGFRDFPPEDFALRAHIQDAWRRTALRYGFEEYEGPPLESLDLYVEKSGEEIVGQLYNFVDKGDRSIALRPEMTPSLARILGERSRGMSKPIRWFSIPQLFRYERPQRGRLREHFQLNVDVIGEAGTSADAEVLAVALDSLRALGLTEDDFCARVSDRRLMTALLQALGVAEDRVPAAFGVIDKVERLPVEVADEILAEEVGLDAGQIEQLRALLEPGDLDERLAPFIGSEAVAEAAEPLRQYRETLTAMGLGAFVRVDLRIVRGLAYYTGIVFELFDTQAELRAICGGGRYDRLLELVGGEPLPAVGFGMGDVVLGELLADRGLIPGYNRSVDFFIVPVSEALRGPALGLAHDLREKGHSVLYTLKEQGVGKQMKVASREGARVTVIVGPDEWERGCVVAKDMATGDEREVALSELG